MWICAFPSPPYVQPNKSQCKTSYKEQEDGWRSHTLVITSVSVAK